MAFGAMTFAALIVVYLVYLVYQETSDELEQDLPRALKTR